MSPESLLDSAFWYDILHRPVYQKNVVGFAVDEGHCVVKCYVKQYLFSIFNMVAYFFVELYAISGVIVMKTSNSGVITIV